MSEQCKLCIICSAKQKLKFIYSGYYYYSCPACGLVTTYPYPSNSSIEEHYKKKFDKGNYQILREYSEQYNAIYQDYAKRLKNKMELSGLKYRGAKILDIGCFTGDFLKLLYDQGADVYGEELQSEAVKIANQKLPGRIYEPEASDNKLQMIKFDAVCLVGLVEHVLKPQEVLHRSMAFLKPGGILMIQTPNSASWIAKLMGKYWPPYAPVEHIHLFSRKSLEKVLRQNDFEDISFFPHWKKLPVAYVYNMLQSFGKEFYKLSTPIYKLLPQWVTRQTLPFYIGEMIMMARKKLN